MQRFTQFSKTAIVKAEEEGRLPAPDMVESNGRARMTRRAGYTINQIDEYRACGVDGIHLYALNKYDDVAYIAKEAGLIDLV